jgi:hypothetical protein
MIREWKETVWPFDGEAAKTIECHVLPIYRGKLYVWRKANESYYYTISCGRNSERSMTGFTGTQDLALAKTLSQVRPEVRG